MFNLNKSPIKKQFMRLWQSVAVILLIVSISLGYLLCKAEKDDSGITQQCISGTQMKTFFLPDGSRVSMNRGVCYYIPNNLQESTVVFF